MALLKINGREYDLEVVKSRYSFIKGLCEDLSETDLELDPISRISENHLDWLFGTEKLEDPSEALVDYINWLDGNKRYWKFLIDKVRSQWSKPHYYPTAIRRAWLDILKDTNRMIDSTKKAERRLAETLLLPIRVDLQNDLLPPLDDRWCLAGGFVANAISGEVRPESDLDIFVLNRDSEALEILIKYYQGWSRTLNLKAYVAQRGNMLTVAIQDRPLIQLILTSHADPFGLVLGFDVNPVRCFWDSKTQNVAATIGCLESLETKMIRDHGPNIRSNRVHKFKQRGFVFQPDVNLDLSEEDQEYWSPLELDWTTEPNVLKETISSHRWAQDGVWTLSECRLKNFASTNDYWNDRSETQVRACLLPKDWYRKLEIVSKTVNIGYETYVEFDELRYNGKKVVFELEPHQILPIDVRFEIIPWESKYSNPSRVKDTRRLLKVIDYIDNHYNPRKHNFKPNALYGLAKEEHDNLGIIKTSQFGRWSGRKFEYVLRLNHNKASELKDSRGFTLKASEVRELRGTETRVFAPTHDGKIVQCRVVFGEIVLAAEKPELRGLVDRATLVDAKKDREDSRVARQMKEDDGDEEEDDSDETSGDMLDPYYESEEE